MAIRKPKEDKVFDIINFIILLILALIVLYPLYFIVLRCYVGTKLYINENPTKLIHKQHEADAPLFTRRVVGFFLCSY